MLSSARTNILQLGRSRISPYGLRCYATAGAHEHRDVVIVGGGPAGLALASALSSSNVVRDSLRVTLVEAGDLAKVKEWKTSPGIYHNRVSSITNSSRGFLEEIGVWSCVEEERIQPIEDMQVWDGISDARIAFTASDLPLQRTPHLTTMVENLNLQRASLRHLSQFPEVELLDNVKVQSITPDESETGSWPLVHLSDGRVIRARLLIGADGLNSPVRKYACIESYGWAYDTHAIVATLRHAAPGPFQNPNTVAFQRFLPTGPIAFLPLSENASSLVWSTKPQLASALKATDPRVLVGMVNAAFRLPAVSIKYLHERVVEAQQAGTPMGLAEFLEELAFRERSDGIDGHSALSSLVRGQNAGGIPPEGADAVPPLVTSVQEGTVASFPLRFSHAEAYIGQGAGARTVLVGDAAHTIHPLAGQGLNGGLGDVEALASCIEAAVRTGADIGSYTALKPYARERYLENHTTLSTCDKLHKIYSFTAAPVVWARSVGVEVLNELNTLKAALVLAAGSERRKKQPGVVGWELAAKSVETFAKSMDNVRSVGGALGNMAGAGLKYVFQQAADSRRP